MGVLVYLTVSASAIGGFLFGCDVGVISGVLIMDPFEDRFGYAHNSLLKGFIVSSLVQGCFFGSLAASYLADRFGRKVSIIIGSIMSTIGSALQASLFEIGQILVGRIVAGLAIGVLSMVVPLYQSEIALKEIRVAGPTIFKTAGFVGSTAQLTATAINGAVNVPTTIPAVIYVDRLGRRPLLLAGTALMALAMILVGALIAIFAPQNYDDKLAGFAIIALIYIFVAFFACTWGPIGWIYPSEIYSTRVRAKCMSITTASNWAFNFIALVVPPLIDSISWRLYIIFGVCGVLMFLFVYFFVPETKGKSLEHIGHMLGGRVNLEEENKV
ncbi:hypothetical protein K7432_001255 [Basidiobolus ranarum]|uniref:Major facilitator superfamily (MFS) profile domain-containing protein n=1 Tax=Basidiobolus ranarum TaxID=34480 RepID=A0ABR2W9Y2_9FUNG